MRLFYSYQAIIMVASVLLIACTPILAYTAENDQKATVQRQEHQAQAPFIENRGYIENEEVMYFAQTFGGFCTLYVEKNGTLVYNFPGKDKNNLFFKEIFTDNHISLNPQEPVPDNVIELFKQKGYIEQDTSVVNFYRMQMGEIYKGIELELTVYVDAIEKLLTISPRGNPKAIKIRIQGAKGLKVDEDGNMEIITEQGPGKFRRPYAFQIIKDQTMPVDVSYDLKKGTTYGFKAGKYDKGIPLMIIF